MLPNASRIVRKTCWVFMFLAVLALVGVISIRVMSANNGIYDTVLDRAGNLAVLADGRLWMAGDGRLNPVHSLPAAWKHELVAASDGIDGYIVGLFGGRQIGRLGPDGNEIWSSRIPEEAGLIQDVLESGGRVYLGTNTGIWIVNLNGAVEGRLALPESAVGGCGDARALGSAPGGKIVAIDGKARMISVFDTEGRVEKAQWMDTGSLYGLSPQALFALTDAQMIVAGRAAGHPVLAKYNLETGSVSLLPLPERAWGGRVCLGRAAENGFVLLDVEQGTLWRYSIAGTRLKVDRNDFGNWRRLDSSTWRSLYRVLFWAAMILMLWAILGGIAAWRVSRRPGARYGVWALISPICGLELLSCSEREERKGSLLGVILCAMGGLLFSSLMGVACWKLEPVKLVDASKITVQKVRTTVLRLAPIPFGPYDTFLSRERSSEPLPEEHYRLGLWYLHDNFGNDDTAQAALAELSSASAGSGIPLHDLFTMAQKRRRWTANSGARTVASPMASRPRAWLNEGEGEFHIIAAGPLDRALLKRLEIELSARLNRHCVVLDGIPLDIVTFDPESGRVRAVEILGRVPVDGALWTFVVTSGQLDTEAISEIDVGRRASIMSLPSLAQGGPVSEKVLVRATRAAFEHLAAAANAGGTKRDHKNCTSLTSPGVSQMDSAILEPDAVCRLRISILLDLWAYLEANDPNLLSEVWADQKVDPLREIARTGAISLWQDRKAEALETLTQIEGKAETHLILMEMLAAVKTRLTGSISEPAYAAEQRPWVAGLVWNMADRLLNRAPEESIYWAERARRLGWKPGQVELTIGQACMRAKAYQQAFVHFSKALDAGGGSNALYICYPVAADRAEQALSARKRIEGMVTKGDTREQAQAWVAMGVLELENRELQRAVTAFRRATALDPKSPVAYGLLARTWAEMNMPVPAAIASARFSALGGREDILLWAAREEPDTAGANENEGEPESGESD